MTEKSLLHGQPGDDPIDWAHGALPPWGTSPQTDIVHIYRALVRESPTFLTCYAKRFKIAATALAGPPGGPP